MRAVVREQYGAPADVLHLEELTVPVPGAGEVLVRVHASSVNTADLEHLRGRPLVARVGTGFTRPRHRIPGFDLAGVVEAVGDGVTGLAIGDRVWADLFSHGVGAFADYACAPERAFTRMPDLPFDVAATVPHSGLLALQALTARGPVEPGWKVLVNGAGGCVGPFAIQLAKAWGADVTGVDHRDRFELMRTAGADHVIDYTSEEVTRSSERYDLIVDIAATRSVLAFRRILTPHGRYMQISRGLGGFFGAAVFGALLGGSRKMGVFGWAPSRPADLDTIGQLIVDGRVRPVIDRRVALDDAPDAIRDQEAGRARGKVVVTLVPSPAAL
jgi:NADPH:quinone reductase-like Zn-dependent oxidoreductase